MTATIGNCSSPYFSMALRRRIPVVVSSRRRALFQQIRPLGVQDADQIAAIIDDQVRLRLQRENQVFLVFFRARIVFGENRDSRFHQRRRHIILSGQRIAAGDRHLRAPASRISSARQAVFASR